MLDYIKCPTIRRIFAFASLDDFCLPLDDFLIALLDDFCWLNSFSPWTEFWVNPSRTVESGSELITHILCSIDEYIPYVYFTLILGLRFASAIDAGFWRGLSSTHIFNVKIINNSNNILHTDPSNSQTERICPRFPLLSSSLTMGQ